MNRPKLQLACDHSDLPSALAAIKACGEEVDILEVGTVLLLQTGQQAIACFRALYPDKPLVADPKCADAGGTVAANCHQAGATYMTCICSASIATMQAAAKEIPHIQVELYGEWQIDQAKAWLAAGINEVIYHQSRDALLAGDVWGEKDLEKVRQLCEMGFSVSVTGGLLTETLSLFAGVPVSTFIAGRGITEADDPRKSAVAFKAEIRRIWGG